MSYKIVAKSLLKKLPYELYIDFLLGYRKIKRILNRKELDYKSAYYYRKNRNAKEKYCIFRIYVPHGILAVATRYIFMYEFARSKGFIPLMDFEYAYNFQQYNLGNENYWESIFEQSITVKEALTKDFVLVEDLGMAEWLDKMCMEINGDRNDYLLHARQDNWREYYAKVNPYVKKCWVLKKSIRDEYKHIWNSKIRNGDKVLGIALREEFSTDVEKPEEYSKVYNNHPSVPSIEETLQIVKNYMEKWQCNKIFLSTQYKESIELFLKEWGQDKIVYLERIRMNMNFLLECPTNMWDMSEKEYYDYGHSIDSEESQEIQRKYVEEVFCLSECDYFIGAVCSASITALSLNGGKYRDIYILPDKNKIDRY